MPKHEHTKHSNPRKPYSAPSRGTVHSASSAPSRPRRRPDADADHEERGAARRPRQEGRAGETKAKAQPNQLDLSGQQLAAPPSAANLANVAKLNLSNCGLASIAFAKHAAATLTWLNVSGNALASADAWAGIEQLHTLFVLNASHCGLTDVPACVASLSKLKALVLSHNSLTSLKHVGNLADLNTIVVSNNALTALPPALATLPSLKKVSAAHNRLTSTSLPDLSALAHLHELRLNDNPTLTSLPSHFGSWGKADGAKGLEILDLGNCGFESWFGLRELAKQGSVVNLGLKGNKVAEDAVRETGFDQFKAKLTILLPALRILDTHRFDAKFADLKTRRASRTEEQKILDAGPMALAANAARAAPVAVDDMLRARERERENKRRRRKGIAEELGDGVRAKKRVRTDEGSAEPLGAEGGSEEPATTGADEAAAKKEQKDVEEERKKPKKRKSRAEKRAAKEGITGEMPADEVESSHNAVEPARATASPDVVTASTSAPIPAAGQKKDKSAGKKKKKGGVLAALQGDDDSAPAVRAPKPAPAPTPPAAGDPTAAPTEEKQKTSVAKIIEVRRPGAADGKGGKKRNGAVAESATPKVDVGALLGLTKSPAVEAAEAHQRDKPAGRAGLSAGTGLFGGGGWD